MGGSDKPMRPPYSRIVVTGASGMVGRHLIDLLTDKGVTVLAASRRRLPEFPERVSWQRWNLANWQGVEELDARFPNADAIIHAGAAIPGHGDEFDERALFDSNVRACLDLAIWARAREIPIVFVSSSTVYSDPERDGIVETDATGHNELGGAYGLSKRLAEDIFFRFAAEGLPVSVLRPSSIYGPGMPEYKMPTRFLKAAGKAGCISLVPPAEDRHDLVYARDVAVACIAALEAGARGIFNIGGSRSVSVAELARACVAVVGGGWVEMPADKGSSAATVRFGLDCTAARAAFGFNPATTLEGGIEHLWRAICADQVTATL